MTRWRLLIEYDGGGFIGWQRQESGISVQGAIEEALTRFTRETPTVYGAGRTDTGVHATGQVAHVDLEADIPAKAMRDATNHHLKPHPVAIIEAEVVDSGFHARFSATGRAYRYRILNRRAPPVLDRGHVWKVAQPLDVDAMNAAARPLLGRHDFTSFRAAQCQAKSPIRTLDRLAVSRDGETIAIAVEARSFLHNQVRIMTGTLVEVGRGRLAPEAVRDMLEAADRTAAGPTAPPDGLCLTAVRYD